MTKEKFEMLESILKILESHSDDQEIIECCIDIIEKWNSELTTEQKNTILMEFFEIRKGHDRDKNKEKLGEEEYKQRIRDFFNESQF
jgi:hypothetical protein